MAPGVYPEQHPSDSGVIPEISGYRPSGSMYPNSIYFGLKVVPRGPKYILFGYMDPLGYGNWARRVGVSGFGNLRGITRDSKIP